MKLWTSKPSLMFVLAVLLLALLPLLAALQYRWLGEVSRGERERMQASLRASVAQFCQDFDRELTRAFITFQAGASPLHEPTPQRLAELYQQWLATAPHPQLLSELYRVEADADEQLHLSRFNQVVERFEPAPWPDELGALRQRLEQHRQLRARTRLVLRNLVIPPRGVKGEGTVLQFSLGTIAEEIPALLIPLLSFPLDGNTTEVSVDPLRSYLIVTLNLDYIKQQLIPTLVGRYFSSGDRSDYQVTVFSRHDERNVIYQSEGQAADFSSGDATGNFFSVRFNEFDKLLLPRLRPAVGITRDSKARQFAIGIFRDALNLSGNTAGGSANSFKLERDEEPPWQIVVRHRAGSLEAAVARVRHRNLVISFGILLLLAGSVVMLLVSTRRAQRLAGQQMEFVAGVSHELRTPLAVIRSAAENLADGVIDEREQIKRYGILIRNEGRRLSEMVEQVLEFASLQSDRKSYQFHPAKVNDLIEQAIAACQPQLGEGGYQLELDISPDLPQVLADTPALKQALQNLLSNAMKYGGERRWIGIKAQSGDGERGPEVCITIADRGIGIAPAELARIFEPFYRGKEVVAAQIHGNGLGLSLVKRVIEAHGGSVSVTSVPGQGSSFTLHLPVKVQADRKPDEAVQENYEQAHFAR